MSDVRRLSNFISRTISGPMWHGPALSEVLTNVTAEDAAARPIDGAHSIWEMVLHMAAWAEIAHVRLGDKPPTGDPAPDEDWPPVTGRTKADWQEAVNRLYKSYRVVAEDAALTDLPQLRRIIPGRDHSVQEMFHGLIEHGSYHGGQIALLKKALTAAAATRATLELPEE